MKEAPYKFVAFYKYVRIEDAEQFASSHLAYCREIGIGGRIYIADEGINGQLSGTLEQCDQYMADLVKDARFHDVDFKVDESWKHGFRKIHVRYKKEIVHSGLKGIVDPILDTGKHLKADEFKALKRKPGVVLLDVRSNYETRIGKFKDALTMDLENFREFPEKIKQLESQLKDKTVITYCTGGIKCEKASLYLEKLGVKDVYQLEGGILKYAKEAGGEDFEGQCYVFDERVVADVNVVNPTVISHCIHCGAATPRIINCSNDLCNDQVVMCESCGWEWEGACSENCRTSENRRPYDGTGYYVKKGSVRTVAI
jgi:UPF0176 protein